MYDLDMPAVMLGLALALASVILLRSSAKARRAEDACIHCGYSLKGVLANAICPECGRSQLSNAHEKRGSGTRWWLACALGPLLAFVFALAGARPDGVLEVWWVMSVRLSVAIFLVVTVALIPTAFLSRKRLRVLVLACLTPTIVVMCVVAAYALFQPAHANKTSQVIDRYIMFSHGTPIFGAAAGFWALAVAAQVMRWKMVHR